MASTNRLKNPTSSSGMISTISEHSVLREDKVPSGICPAVQTSRSFDIGSEQSNSGNQDSFRITTVWPQRQSSLTVASRSAPPVSASSSLSRAVIPRDHQMLPPVLGTTNDTRSSFWFSARNSIAAQASDPRFSRYSQISLRRGSVLSVSSEYDASNSGVTVTGTAHSRPGSRFDVSLTPEVAAHDEGMLQKLMLANLDAAEQELCDLRKELLFYYQRQVTRIEGYSIGLLVPFEESIKLLELYQVRQERHGMAIANFMAGGLLQPVQTHTRLMHHVHTDEQGNFKINADNAIPFPLLDNTPASGGGSALVLTDEEATNAESTALGELPSLGKSSQPIPEFPVTPTSGNRDSLDSDNRAVVSVELSENARIWPISAPKRANFKPLPLSLRIGCPTPPVVTTVHNELVFDESVTSALALPVYKVLPVTPASPGALFPDYLPETPRRVRPILVEIPSREQLAKAKLSPTIKQSTQTCISSASVANIPLKPTTSRNHSPQIADERQPPSPSPDGIPPSPQLSVLSVTPPTTIPNLKTPVKSMFKLSSPSNPPRAMSPIKMVSQIPSYHSASSSSLSEMAQLADSISSSTEEQQPSSPTRSESIRETLAILEGRRPFPPTGSGNPFSFPPSPTFSDPIKANLASFEGGTLLEFSSLHSPPDNLAPPSPTPSENLMTTLALLEGKSKLPPSTLRKTKPPPIIAVGFSSRMKTKKSLHISIPELESPSRLFADETQASPGDNNLSNTTNRPICPSSPHRPRPSSISKIPVPVPVSPTGPLLRLIPPSDITLEHKSSASSPNLTRPSSLIRPIIIPMGVSNTNTTTSQSHVSGTGSPRRFHPRAGVRVRAHTTGNSSIMNIGGDVTSPTHSTPRRNISIPKATIKGTTTTGSHHSHNRGPLSGGVGGLGSRLPCKVSKGCTSATTNTGNPFHGHSSGNSKEFSTSTTSYRPQMATCDHAKIVHGPPEGPCPGGEAVSLATVGARAAVIAANGRSTGNATSSGRIRGFAALRSRFEGR